MVELKKVLNQLSNVGYKARVWQRSEVKELCNVLHEDEIIIQATNGYYEGGFSLLVATDHRLVLVDRKPMFLTLDSIAYSMIQEVTFNYRLLNSTIHIYTSNKVLDFNSWNHAQIRNILSTTQTAMRNLRVNSNNVKLSVEPHDVIYDDLPESGLLDSDIPDMTLQIPHFLNDNTESAYISNSSINEALPINPVDLSTGSKIDKFKSVPLTQRQYQRHLY